MAGSCGYGNEPSGSLRARKFSTSCEPVNITRRSCSMELFSLFVGYMANVHRPCVFLMSVCRKLFLNSKSVCFVFYLVTFC